MHIPVSCTTHSFNALSTLSDTTTHITVHSTGALSMCSQHVPKLTDFWRTQADWRGRSRHAGTRYLMSLVPADPAELLRGEARKGRLQHVDEAGEVRDLPR